jgi:hypothetical protein
VGKREGYRQDLAERLARAVVSGESGELERYIVTHSNLPGPRGNLELALAFGDVVGEHALQGTGLQRLWNLCLDLTELSAEEAPVNDPRELIPFCGAVGLGAIGSAIEAYCHLTLTRLRDLAVDPRWRMREAVCFGLQNLLRARKKEALAALESWVARGELLQMRAVAAGLAEPALLEDRETAMAALQFHRDILTKLPAVRDRSSDAFRSLRKGLGYTLSVIVCAAPEEGFALLGELAESQDRDIRWIVKENLKKKRLVKAFPDQVVALKAYL